MMVSGAIFLMIAAAVCSSFVGIVRLTGVMITEAEVSIRMRDLRERLLFHVTPSHDGKCWSGLLSGERGVEGGFKIRTPAEGFDVLTGRSAVQTVELVRHGGDGFFTNDGYRDAADWLNPGGVPMLADQVFDADVQQKQDDLSLYVINLEAEVRGEVIRRERIVVPVFGRAQVRNETNVFHD